MRIIENNYNTCNDIERNCPECGSRFAYVFNDIKLDSVTHTPYVICPCCGTRISTSNKDKFPTTKSITYPGDFHSYANAVKVKDNETNEWIKKCVGDLDKDTDYSFMASGDTIVFAFKSDEDVPSATVVVAKKYQEADVKISRKNF